MHPSPHFGPKKKDKKILKKKVKKLLGKIIHTKFYNQAGILSFKTFAVWKKMSL